MEPANELAKRYDRVSATLHWVVAGLTVAMLALGLAMVDVPRRTQLRGELFDLHKSLGIVLLGLMILRTTWRLTHRQPPHAGLGEFNALVARTVHGLLYLLLLVQPLAGLIASSLGTYGVAFFGIPLPTWTTPDPARREVFVTAHRIIARLLIALILLHIAGSLVHWAQGRHDILRRMWPWMKGPR